MRTVRSLASAALALMMGVAGAVTITLTSARPAAALDSGLALTPQMGFNNWNATHCGADLDEDMAKSIADLFVSSGLKDAGYEYVNLDDCWAAKNRDANGDYVADPTRFPHGIKALAGYVHSKGLKFGLYSSAGTMTCAQTMPGSLGHEQQDARLWASWGVDYLKYDNCNNQGQDAVTRYTAMRDALLATGRPILYSICEWGQNKPWLWAKDVGDSWRTTGDISDSYSSMLSIVHQNMALAQYAGPGHWNDPDMLEIGNGGMTGTEYRSHFSLWSEMAAPLLIGSDLRKATAATMAILTNKEVIAIDQDELGVQGAPISTDGGRDVFVKPLRNGDRAIALFNESDSPQRIGTTASAAGLPASAAYTVRDLWQHSTTETAGTIAATVPAHGTVLLRVAASGQWPQFPPAVDASVEYYTAGKCSSVSAYVGVDDEKTANGSVTFEVWADGTRAAASGLLTTADPQQHLTAGVTGATFVRLIVTDGGNGNDSDHADWADAQITCT
jgi:alpha-galactosidase